MKLKWLIVERKEAAYRESGTRWMALPCADDEMLKVAMDLFEVKDAPSFVIAEEVIESKSNAKPGLRIDSIEDANG